MLYIQMQFLAKNCFQLLLEGELGGLKEGLVENGDKFIHLPTVSTKDLDA